jgi:hypothetical protein
MSFDALCLIARLAADPLCELARLESDETGVETPLVAWLGRLAQDEASALGEPLGRRLLSCRSNLTVRRVLPGEDPRAYLATVLPGYDAVIRALVLPMPEALKSLPDLLGDPDLSPQSRVEAALALDPTGAWIAHTLAFGPHPFDMGAFAVVAEPAPIPMGFGILERHTGAIVLTRQNRDDAETIAAVLMAFPEDGRRLAQIRAGLDQRHDTSDPSKRSSEAERQRILWQAAWTDLGARSRSWREARAIPADPWSTPRFGIV